MLDFCDIIVSILLHTLIHTISPSPYRPTYVSYRSMELHRMNPTLSHSLTRSHTHSLTHTVHSTNITFFKSYPSCSARHSDRWRMASSASAVNSSPRPTNPPPPPPPPDTATTGAGVVPVVTAAPVLGVAVVAVAAPPHGTGPGSASMACLTSSCLGATVLPNEGSDDDDDDGNAGRAVFFAGLLGMRMNQSEVS